jgi:hypothetical protein
MKISVSNAIAEPSGGCPINEELSSGEYGNPSEFKVELFEFESDTGELDLGDSEVDTWTIGTGVCR